jgi:hypothetical protein
MRFLTSYEGPLSKILSVIGDVSNTSMILLPDGYVYVLYEQSWYVSCTPWTGGTNMYSRFMGYTSFGVLYAEFLGGAGLTFERIPDLQIKMLRAFG